jgi:hypothetical protein
MGERPVRRMRLRHRWVRRRYWMPAALVLVGVAVALIAPRVWWARMIVGAGCRLGVAMSLTLVRIDELMTDGQVRPTSTGFVGRSHSGC